MSDTILGGRWVIYYEVENRQKRIVRDSAVDAGTTDSVVALYSALQDQFDELNQMDDGTPMSAQTPTEFTIGIIDAGDDDPWFIDRVSAESLTGGAITTASWTRSASNTGIVRVPYTVGTGTDFVTADIGLTVTHDDGDTGTLLDFQSDGSTGVAWVRPTDATATHDWDSTSGSFHAAGGGSPSASVAQSAASSSGESLWANVFTLGTLETNTHIYLEQDGALLTGYKTTTDWWSDGQIDILVNVREVGTLVDEGVIKVFARQYSKTYDNFESDLSSGGRNPIPLATADDLNNTSGYRTVTTSGSSGAWAADDVLENQTQAIGTSVAVVTAVSGSNPTITLEYYLIGDPLLDFTNGDVIGNLSQSESPTPSAVAGTPANAGPAALVGLSVTHAANETFDIDEDGTTENYSIVIDVSDERLTDAYEWMKYTHRRGETGTGDTDGVQGQFYLGADRKIAYTTLIGTVAEGSVVVQQTTGATGTVLAHNTTDNFLILRTSRGTFNTTDLVETEGSPTVGSVSGLTVTVITPVKASPFGTFAGGTFFGAPGVVLANVNALDTNNYQLTDDDGNVVTAPSKVNVTVGNSRAGDRIAVFRLDTAGGVIQKDQYTATAQSAGATTVIIAEAITVDTPGKTDGGTLRIVDDDGDVEYRLRFTSWATSTFTLTSTTGLTADAGTNTTTIVDTGTGSPTGAFNAARVGDLIRNTTAGGISYISAITDESTVTIDPPITGQTTGDSYEINTLPAATTTSDTVYVPFLDVHETAGTDAVTGSETKQIVYDADVPVRIRARQGKVILPYEADATITSTGLSNNIIRTPDTIAV